MTDIIENLITDCFLWDRAYDIFKNEKNKSLNLIAMYEDILSRMLIRDKYSFRLRQLFLKADSRQYSLDEDIISSEWDKRCWWDHESNLSVWCDCMMREAERDNRTWFKAYERQEDQHDTVET